MARREELLISRSSTLRSRRALVAAAEAAGWGGLVGERTGLVMGEASKCGRAVVGVGIVDIGLDSLAIEVMIVACGRPVSGNVNSLLRRFR